MVLFRPRNRFGSVGDDDLIALIKPLLRSFWLLRAGGGKNEAGSDGYLEDLLFKEFRQVVGRPRFGNEFGQLGQFRKVLVGKSWRTDKGDDGVGLGVVFDSAHEAAARQTGAQAVFGLFLGIQLVVFELEVAELFERATEGIQLGSEFRLARGGNGDEDESASGADEFGGLFGHDFTDALVESDVVLRGLEFAVVNPGCRSGDGQNRTQGEEDVFTIGWHGSNLKLKP